MRIRGIDTPEIRGKCAAEKTKAKAARDFLRNPARNRSDAALKSTECDVELEGELHTNGNHVNVLAVNLYGAQPWEGDTDPVSDVLIPLEFEA